MKHFTLLVVFASALLYLFSCKSKNYRHDEILSVAVMDTTIEVKISYPENWTKNDKIIIWSLPPLYDEFFPDSITNKMEVQISPILRKALLDSGYVNIEYIGRNDSVLFMDRKYRASDLNTKATDLESLLDYIKLNNRLKEKKIVLIGNSEGGVISAIIAGKRRNDFSALLQLATPSFFDIRAMEYQREKTTYPGIELFSGNQEYMDQSYNRMSSLDSYHTADIDGYKQFFKENYLPIEKIIYEFENMDSVYYHIDLYLRDRWQKEDKETKDAYNNNFNFYYHLFAGEITPQQIALKTVKPEQYYPLIKCPVFAVQGTADNFIDCYPNIERIEQLLKEGGNFNFKKLILEGYKHILAKWDGGEYYEEDIRYPISVTRKPNPNDGYYVENSVIQKIIEWIDEQ